MKFLCVASIVVLVVFLKGSLCEPVYFSEQEIREAAHRRDWDKFSELIRDSLMQNIMNDNQDLVRSGSVRNLKPSPGVHVYGESEYAFHSSSNINGKVQKESLGHKVINKDGTVHEYDFEPKLI